MTVKVNFTDDDWTRIEKDWTAWWGGELDRAMVMIEWPNFLLGFPDEYSRGFLLEKPVDEVVDFYGQRLASVRYYGDAFPRWWPNFGPGIAAGFLGAEVVCSPEHRTVWFEAGESKPLEEIHFSYDPDNIWWKRVQSLTRSAVEQWGDRVCVGHTDLGGAMDIVVSFRGTENLLCDLIDTPEEVERVVGELTPVWLRYYDELHEIVKSAGCGTTPWAPVWSPARTYMLQCDFSYGISPAMFERFAVPDLEECCRNLDHAFYHLDGKGAIPHLDALLSIENLSGIQWIPGAGEPQAEEWLPLLKRILDAGKRCQVYVTQDGARKIVKELGGRGLALSVFPFPPMSEEDILDFVAEMKTY